MTKRPCTYVGAWPFRILYALLRKGLPDIWKDIPFDGQNARGMAYFT